MLTDITSGNPIPEPQRADLGRWSYDLRGTKLTVATGALSLLAATAIATVALPFVLGYWIGNPVLGAAPFAALGLTVLIRQLEISTGGDETGKLVLGILFSTAVSAAAAYAGGRIRERRRRETP